MIPKWNPRGSKSSIGRLGKRLGEIHRKHGHGGLGLQQQSKVQIFEASEVKLFTSRKFTFIVLMKRTFYLVEEMIIILETRGPRIYHLNWFSLNFKKRMASQFIAKLFENNHFG